MINNYAILELLGQGSFGKVKRAIKRVGNVEYQYAIKILKKSHLKRKKEWVTDEDGNKRVKSALEDVKREIAIMKKIDHPNLIILHEVIENPDNDKIMMGIS